MEHQIDLDLESGARLQLLLFSATEQTWTFKYRYIEHEGEAIRGKVVLLNDYTLVVRYENGEVSGSGKPMPGDDRPTFPVSLWMNVVFPKKMGQVYAYGMDISPGSKGFFQFEYGALGDSLLLREIRVGASKRMEIKSLPDSQALIKQLPFPFPVLDKIEPEFGKYSVPFFRSDGGVRHFGFPCCTKRPLP